MEDYGIFGPDSVAWRVWAYPTSPTVGFQRTVVVEELDPFLVASVHATQKIVSHAHNRYDRTSCYSPSWPSPTRRRWCGRRRS